MSDRFRKMLIPVAFLLLFHAGCVEKKIEAPKRPDAVPVIVGDAISRKVEYLLNQVGTLIASQQVILRSEIEGRVVEILFTEGGDVKSGDTLIKLDSAKIQAEIRNLESRINQLQIRLANKNRTLERNRPLLEKNLVSRMQFDDLQTEISETEAEIAQAQAKLALEKVLLSDTIIRAPFAGVAGERNLSIGDYLKIGDPVLTIVDLDPLEISFQVPEKYTPSLSLAQTVQLSVAPYPDRVFQGTLFFLAPEIDINTRMLLVKARVANGERLLKPGLFARVKLVTEVHENAVTVPWESIIQTENETYLYTVEEDKAHKVPIRLGQITNEWAELVESGLSPGAQVVLEGKYAVKEGVKVKVQPRPQSSKT